jgi:hypothetical protein
MAGSSDGDESWISARVTRAGVRAAGRSDNETITHIRMQERDYRPGAGKAAYVTRACGPRSGETKSDQAARLRAELAEMAELRRRQGLEDIEEAA